MFLEAKRYITGDYCYKGEVGVPTQLKDKSGFTLNTGDIVAIFNSKGTYLGVRSVVIGTANHPIIMGIGSVCTPQGDICMGFSCSLVCRYDVVSAGTEVDGVYYRSGKEESSDEE